MQVAESLSLSQRTRISGACCGCWHDRVLRDCCYCLSCFCCCATLASHTHTQWGRSESEMSAHARRGPQLTLSLQTKASLAALLLRLRLRLWLWLWLLHVILIKGPQEPHTLFTCDDAGCGSGKWVAAAAAASVVANWLQRSQLAECLITWALIMYVAVSAGFSHTSQIALLIFIKVNRKGANILYIVPDRHT